MTRLSRYVDPALALLFVVTGQLEALLRTTDGYSGGGAVVNHVVGLVVAVPLAWRRRAPYAAWLVACGGLLLLSLPWAHALYFWSHLVPLCVLVYAVARRESGWRGRWSWLLGVLATVSAMIHVPSAREPSNVVFALLTLGGCTLAGRLVRRGSTTRRRLQEALRSLDEEHRAAEDSAVRAERARIAGEVQDVVAHAVGLMLVQMGAARLGLEAEGRVPPAQLVAAEETGRRALAELRRSVGLLEPDESSAPLEPMPDLGQLDDLVRGFRSAGLDVRLEVGVPDDLPVGLQLTAYRILQEALTNALKHGGRGPVRVRVRGGASEIALDVRSDLARATPPTSTGGHGLIGMRERVAMFEGALQAGPVDGEFVVDVTLPVPATLAAVTA